MTGDGGDFGARLSASRRAAGLSQEELATRSGLSARAISNLERGRTAAPHPASARRLAAALGLPPAAQAEFLAAARRLLPPASEDIPDLAAAEAVVPRQLPAPPAHFTGRRHELATLTRLLTAPATAGAGPVCVIGGAAGVGKTALAVRWAHTAAAGFPDGQLFVNLRGFDPAGSPAAPAEALAALIEALGVAPGRLPRSLEALAGLYRSLLADRRALIVLDNARDAAQVRLLLPAAPGCPTIVTSRSRLTGLAARDGAAQLALRPLSNGDARDLLAARLGTAHAADRDAAAQITRHCGRLPLALCITAARAALRPDLTLAQVARELGQGKLDALSVAGDPHADVRTVFSWSYQALEPDSARMFRLLGLHPGPAVSAAAAASLAGVPADQAARSLADLAESSLLTVTTDGGFGLHDLIRGYAAELAAGPADGHDGRGAALRRVLDHYLATAAAAARLLDDTPLPTRAPPLAPGVRPEQLASQAQALEWFDREYAVLVRLPDLAAGAGFDVHAWQLTRALRIVFDRHARWQDWDHTHRVAAEAATRLGDIRAQALTYLAWAKCEGSLARWKDAEDHLGRAHDLFGALGDRLGQARVLVNLGIVTAAAGRNREALAWAERAYELYADLGDPDGQAGSLVNQGLYRQRLGDPAAAKKLLVRARGIFITRGQRHGEAVASNNLGLACRDLGDYPAAIDCHQQAAALFGECGDRAGQAECTNDLADAYHAAGQRDQAVRACGEALAILTGLGHPAAASTRAKLARYQSLEPEPSA